MSLLCSFKRTWSFRNVSPMYLSLSMRSIDYGSKLEYIRGYILPNQVAKKFKYCLLWLIYSTQKVLLDSRVVIRRALQGLGEIPFVGPSGVYLFIFFCYILESLFFLNLLFSQSSQKSLYDWTNRQDDHKDPPPKKKQQQKSYFMFQSLVW